jgi:hypothetical protein
LSGILQAFFKEMVGLMELAVAKAIKNLEPIIYSDL